VSNQDKQAIESAISDFIAAYNASDVPRLMRVYSDDYVEMPEGDPTVSGVEGKRKTAERIGKVPAQHRGHLAVFTEEIEMAGDLAYDRGTLCVTLTHKSTGKVMSFERRFLEVWRNESDGAWRVIRVVDNAVPASL